MSRQSKDREKKSESSTDGVQENKATKVSRNSPDAPVKMTLYISRGVAKEFKKLAIDEELDYSQLAEQAFTEFVQNHSTFANVP